MVSVGATVVALNCSLCLLGRGAEAASGQVPQKVPEGKSLTFTVETVVREGWPPLREKFYAQWPHGRVELLDTVQIEDWARRKGVRLNRDKKVAYRFDLDSPQWKKHIRSLMEICSKPKEEAWPNGKMEGAEKVQELQIEGRTADVYRLRKLNRDFWISDSISELGENDSLLSYIDRQTQLPVRVEAKWGQTGRWIIWKDFQWNKPLDADLFSLKIPAGYTVIEGEIENTPDPDRQTPAPTVGAEEPGPEQPLAKVAFAEVLQKLTSAETLTCSVWSRLDKQPMIGGKLSIRRDAYRVEIPRFLVHVEDYQQAKAVQLTPGLNRAWRWKLDTRGATETRQRFPNPVDLFRNVKGEQAKSTNTILIEGRRAVVFCVENCDLANTAGAVGGVMQAKTAEFFVCVDPQTALPVRITLKLENPRADFIWTDLEWGKDPDPKVFRLDVPDGYTVIEEPPPRGGLGRRSTEERIPSAPATAK
jgi:outer membrane lipoprotein-sorting protein